MPENSEKISEEVAVLDSGPIPQTVAVSPAVRDYDNQKVVLSFWAYKQNQCQLHKLDKPEVKHLTSELKKISGTLTKHFKHQRSSGIACKPIHKKSDEYAILFNNLPADAEVLEIDYTDTGRIFGFLVQNVFNVVTIAKEHLR